MGRTQRLREAIHTYLGETGEANTTMILDHINSRFRWGATMNQIGNVLARDRRFEKVGFDDRSANGGFASASASGPSRPRDGQRSMSRWLGFAPWQVEPERCSN